MKNNACNKLAIVAIIFAVATILVISGCAQQNLFTEKGLSKTQQPQQQQPQTQQSPLTQAETQPQQQQPQAAPATTAGEDDVYKDNLNQSLDELSQLE